MRAALACQSEPNRGRRFRGSMLDWFHIAMKFGAAESSVFGGATIESLAIEGHDRDRSRPLACMPRQGRSFNAALGRRCVGACPIDVELVKRQSELRRAFACSRGLLVDSEHARLVAVEREWHRQRRPAPCTPEFDPQTTHDRSRRFGPVRQGKPGDSVVAESLAPEVAVAATIRRRPSAISLSRPPGPRHDVL